MKKIDIIKNIIGDTFYNKPSENKTAQAFAPANIALCKYWGKRNEELNLPITSSLSIGLNNYGSEVILSVSASDSIYLNGSLLLSTSEFYQRFFDYVNLFRGSHSWHVKADIKSNIPIAAGLASSASGFASLVLALNKLLSWGRNLKELSILARMGSGSASRSLWHGFVEWHKGIRVDGLDSFAEPLDIVWPELRIGLLIFNDLQKPISSRDAMNLTVETSEIYKSWPLRVENDLKLIKQAIQAKDFKLLGETAESNSVNMHKTMLAANPSIDYSQDETNQAIRKINKLRKQGVYVYYTQDAGPNLKLIFQEYDLRYVEEVFPCVTVVEPFL